MHRASVLQGFSLSGQECRRNDIAHLRTDIKFTVLCSATRSPKTDMSMGGEEPSRVIVSAKVFENPVGSACAKESRSQCLVG